ncbi:hypothetical protein EIN_495870 [Entamoeba invadens IP1]|uniref:Uncharacterized protein n=1 Tax=Entamoeba invadens IP1 TaxID=370355 RepID=A0A0A1TZR0_ENTIV|nr:hypothetical protein EIN_495870 [Entamoeba invadens IP1]ELP87112.1 hypothetical protein EIN_495870 [Entamoeba invadens IP1]|eukprot:XP_004253883.1 hypothetical protein EIN_495870 [Entamoeba invadens IP1]
MSSTQTPGEPDIIRTYVTPSLREYKGFSVPEVSPSTPSSITDKPHVLSGTGQIEDINYEANTTNVPRNIVSFPTRPEVENYKTYEEYETAWIEWQTKAESYTSYMKLPHLLGSEIYFPSNTTNALPDDPWDTLLLTPEPNPSNYDSYESYKSAVQKWIKEVNNIGFLPPHASEIENALMIKMSTEKKSDVAQLNEIMAATFDGFDKDFLFSKKTDCFCIKNCSSAPQRKKFELSNKYENDLKSSFAQGKIEKVFSMSESVMYEPQNVLSVDGVGLSLESLMVDQKEDKNSKTEMTFRINKSSAIFTSILEKTLSNDDPSKSSRRDMNIVNAQNIIKTEKQPFNALYKLLFTPMTVNDFKAVLDAVVDGRTIKQIMLDCVFSPAVNWFFKFALQTICPDTLAKLSYFAKEILNFHGKNLITHFIIGSKDVSMNDKLETMYAAAKVVGKGEYDVFEYNTTNIQALSALVEGSTSKEVVKEVIETIHMNYYLNILSTSVAPLKDLVKNGVMDLTKKEKDVLAVFDFIPKGMVKAELAPLCMFCGMQLIGFADVQSVKYIRDVMGKFELIELLQQVVKGDFKFSNYCAQLIIMKIMTTKDCRCKLLTDLTTLNGVKSVKMFLNNNTPDTLVKILCDVIRFTIKNCMKTESNDKFWKGFTGDYFFESVCIEVFNDSFVNNNEILLFEIVNVMKTLLKMCYENNKLGENCTSDSEKMESVSISSSTLGKMMESINKMMVNNKQITEKKDTLAGKVFCLLIDCLRYIYSVHEHCTLLEKKDNKLLVLLVGVMSNVSTQKDKISPKFLSAITKLHSTVLEVFSQNPAVALQVTGQPTDSQEDPEKPVKERKEFVDKLFTGLLRMKTKQGGKQWNYLSFFAKEASLEHAKVILTFSKNLLEIAFSSKCPMIALEIKKLLGETMFSETTALNMLMQQTGNTEIRGRDLMSYKKGYNCITFPCVMAVAHVIALAQVNKKLIKKVPESKPTMIDIVNETGKKDIDGKSLILSIEQTTKIRKEFTTADGKDIYNCL